jgi:hypothetical protein
MHETRDTPVCVPAIYMAARYRKTPRAHRAFILYHAEMRAGSGSPPRARTTPGNRFTLRRAVRTRVITDPRRLGGTRTPDASLEKKRYAAFGVKSAQARRERRNKSVMGSPPERSGVQ